MDHVARFRALMNFQPVDRLPRIEWATWWDQTIVRWKTEGLPTPLDGTFEIHDYFGLDPYKQFWFPIQRESFPPSRGHGIGWVASEADYEAIKAHLFPSNEDVFESMRPFAERQAHGEAVVWITLNGFFWYPRTLFGIERHLYAFYDQPALMHRINQDLVAYNVDLLKRMAPVCRPTFMTFAEDMSYNHGPMLSRALFDEFVAPYYRQIMPVLRELDIIPIVDSDGDITTLLPWFAEVGVHGFLPLERQAGVDVGRLREIAPRLQIIGHFDKMTMTHGEEAMRAEFERLLPVMRTGGFIPSVDHQTPPGVSLAEYRVYLRLLEKYSVLGAR
jgi:hypothetical protein